MSNFQIIIFGCLPPELRAIISEYIPHNLPEFSDNSGFPIKKSNALYTRLANERNAHSGGRYSHMNLWPTENPLEWKGYLIGPPNTPYEGGVFYLEIMIPTNYPFAPPKNRLITPIYHCNINNQGEHCLDITHKNWTPSTTLAKLMECIYALLIQPDVINPMVKEIAEQYIKNKTKHDIIAKQWTEKYAKLR